MELLSPDGRLLPISDSMIGHEVSHANDKLDADGRGRSNLNLTRRDVRLIKRTSDVLWKHPVL